MRGTVVKKIRKLVYGDLTIRSPQYDNTDDTVRCIGLRKKYKEEKKARRLK